MKKITPQFMPHVQRAPRFVAAVLHAKENKAAVLERLDAFQDDPFLLYSCLWYAYSEGVAVTLLPPV